MGEQCDKAIKEFAEKLKQKARKECFDDGVIVYAFTDEDLNKLIKEYEKM